MLIEKISSDEQKIINIMRHSCGDDDSDFFTGEYVSNDEFLRFWEQEKRPIFEAFGEQLILKKRVCSTIEDDVLYDKMRQLRWSQECERFRINLIEILHQANADNWFKENLKDPQRAYSLSMLELVKDYFFNTDDWISNRYEGCDFELKLPNGSTFKVVRGCKLMKALGRIVKGCGNDTMSADFENVRLRQSQIMNEANITADLCLSIHPLDYMTASYNANDWRSCMCWEDGEYRRGVIEMMNSPMVVVAYIASNSETMSWFNRGEPNLEWNSKRWREFFIVTDEVISGIKGYPYWNRTLEDEALNWLRQIFSDKSNYSHKITSWRYRNYSCNLIEDKEDNVKMRVKFDCGPAMYNDFYHDNEYHSIFAKDMTKDIRINYSGESECICCGQTGYRFDTEGALICTDCVEVIYCAKCGEPIYRRGDMIMHNGLAYCSYCYENLETCDYCGETIDADNDEDVFEFCVGRDDQTETDVMHEVPEGDMYSYRNETPVIHATICSDCAKKFFINGLKEICANHKYFADWYHCYNIVPIDHLTEEGLKFFGKEVVEYFRAKKSYKIASA